ncbi:helix-turn-helix transcriptional regulator [Puniceibacterium sediminis]|uniref:DNA binding domain-containing protein, excisionase family n=1 Tax=Puniceibacterium sediminis TaxID=1608407 RepID=A0A238X063_9RHOB|nr:helix-turn-helix transcriptional regulator [Puniceibacterium sediminis]SNR52090.1 DNA binding domain-containing protein, excisionase family [Puniceibacterium sediminis]
MTETSDQTRPEFLTVRELAELLRIKERKVYDLAATGAVPCSKVTGKLLFPEAEIRAWIARGSSAPAGQEVIARPQVFLGSHDPLLDWALRQSRCGIATYFDGSLDGLDRFDAIEGMASGLHVFDPEAQSWNLPAVRPRFAAQNVVLLAFATRRRGLILPPGGSARIKGIGDLVGSRIAPRQPESGTHGLFEHLRAKAGLGRDALIYTDTARSEADAVMAVQDGSADVAFGLEALARPYGLDFVPVVDERFDLLVDRKAWFDAPLQQLVAFFRSDTFARHAAGLGGYDISEIGAVRWNA